MAWGGARPGAGAKKKNPNSKPRRAAIRVKPVPTLPAEAKAPEQLPAVANWAEMLPEVMAISEKYARGKQPRTRENSPFRLPSFPSHAIPKEFGGVKVPEKSQPMAMDSALMNNLQFSDAAWLAGETLGGLSGEGLLFLGYNYLSELAQRPEYRVMSETIADDATREWIDFDVVGDEKKQKEERAKDPVGFDERMADPDERKKRVQAGGKADRVKELKDDQLRLYVKDRYYEQARNDGFFGRTHLFHDIWTTDQPPTPEELRMPIGDSRDKYSQSKVPIGSFKALRTIEPVWTYPLAYNAINPLEESWYNPQQWFVMGRELHISRLQTFIGHPVPDMLKPAYAFGGLSLSQMAKPYVDIWLQTRQSVADLIHSFSVMVLMTDLQTILQPGNVGALLARVAMFNMLRDNQGTFVVNKNTEDFKNVSASLSGLHELQAQSQEHMASVHRIPLVKFTGIQPSGLNASSEGEIKVYDDTIAAYQSRFFGPNLTKTINFEMLSLWGEVDPDITFRFEPLRQMTQAEKGQKEKDDADRDQKYVDMGAIAPGEVRTVIINNKDLPYTGLNPDDVPEPPVEEGMVGQGESDGNDDDGGEPGKKKPEPKPAPGGGANDADLPFASDAAFNESAHPRADNGEFGSGGGGSKKTARLTSTEKAYLDSYSGDDFLKLNKKLREGDASGPAVEKLDSAIGKMTVAPGTKLYRGISKDALKQLVKGDVIDAGQTLSDPGFLSTTTDRNIADMNSIGGVIMEIEVGEGQKGLDMSKISRNQHEKEVILPRNVGMKVLGLRAPKKVGDPIIVRVSTEQKMAGDEFREGDHPRAPDGKFGSGGGSKTTQKELKTEQMGEKEAGSQKTPGASSLYTAPSKSADQIVASFPGGAEAIQRTREKLAALVPTDATPAEGGFKNPDGTYTPEREALHRKIANDFFTPEKVARALPPQGEKPVLTMLGGRGGSGKSWITGEQGPVDESKNILVDADAVKAMLPGYEGWNASAYHEESSDILKLIDERALALGVNTIHDATLKSEATSAMRMAQYEAAGFEVEGYYMYAAPETAATRAMSRYSKKGTFTGRFVPPEIILSNVNNEKNFDKLSGGFRKWAVYDNNAEGSAGPKLVSKSWDD